MPAHTVLSRGWAGPSVILSIGSSFLCDEPICEVTKRPIDGARGLGLSRSVIARDG